MNEAASARSPDQGRDEKVLDIMVYGIFDLKLDENTPLSYYMKFRDCLYNQPTHLVK